MNATVEKEDIEVIHEEEPPLYSDSLNRGYFVKNVIQIIENLAQQKLSKCYAIKGSWGVGKTHVLDMIEKELFNERRNAEAYDKYVLFHYNAWKYDYYSEPLVSMVASMLESVDEECSFMSPKFKQKFKSILNRVFKTFGILKQLGGKQPSLSDDEKTNANIVAQFFDSNYHLNTTMKKLKEELKKLSPNVTIIVVVDELDRCLPEYAIKVLERLHHIFSDIENTQVILSVDYDQLENTVKTIFGENTSIKRYLNKFINFSITLDEGHIEENFDNEFSDYVGMFQYTEKYDHIVKANDIELFKSLIFEGIDMRQRKEIAYKSQLIHSLVYSEEEKLDISYMCVELVLTLWKSVIDKQSTNFSYPHCFSEGYKKNESENPNVSIPKALKHIEDIYVKSNFRGINGYNNGYYVEEHGDKIIRVRNLWGIILFCVAKISDDSYMGINNGGFYDDNFIEHVRNYWDMLQIIN